MGKYILADSEFGALFDTSPMPPLPMHMLYGIGVAFTIISGCILLSKKYANTKIIDALIKTGQLALTFYVGHVLLGMGTVEVFGFEKLGYYSIEFSVTYAILFSVSCVLFALVWKKYKSSGPLEWIVRKLTA